MPDPKLNPRIIPLHLAQSGDVTITNNLPEIMTLTLVTEHPFKHPFGA
jgi:hypothetical protein